MPSSSIRAHAVATAVLVLCAQSGWAQSATEPDSQESTGKAQRVEITGSRIKRIDGEGPAPVEVMTRKEIEATGASTVSELIRGLAASTGGLSDIGGSNSFAPGASSASLRNLGKQSTLVLLNSRRLGAYPLVDYNESFSNLDSLPFDAVERVEILRSGGSSIYGSDAVAGVINIITRRDYQGVQVSADTERSLMNGFSRSHSAAITAGTGDLEADGYNILANLELYKRDGFFWSQVLKDVNPRYASHSASFGTPSSYSYPGNIIGQGAIAECDIMKGPYCYYDRYSRFEVIPPTRRANLLLTGAVKINSDLTWFSELLYSHIDAKYNGAYAAYGAALGPSIWGDPVTGDAKIFWERGLPAEHPLNQLGEEAEFRYRFKDSGAGQEVLTNQYRFVTGLQGQSAKYDWEAAIGVMGGRSDSKNRGAFSEKGFIETIGDPNVDVLAPDFFNKPGGYIIGQQNSPEVLNKLFPTYGFVGENRQVFMDGKISGDLFAMPAGMAKFATGFDLRNETVKLTPYGGLETGDIVGYGVSSSDASRTFGAVFAEANIPVFDKFEGVAALRLDHFPGFPTHASPKIGFRYQPNQTLLFRGTFEGGFRAPNLSESAKSLKFAYATGVTDPQRCDQALALANALLAQADALPDGDPNKSFLQARADNVYSNECDTGIPQTSRNNPALKPETSKILSLGMAMQLSDTWSATLDYWRIHRKDEIAERNLSELLQIESTLPPGVIVRSPLTDDRTFTPAEQAAYGVTVGPILKANLQFENLYQTRTSGIDIGVKGKVEDLQLGLDATYLLAYQSWAPTKGGFGDNLAGRWGYPKLVLVGSAGFKTGDFNHNFRMSYTSSTSLTGDFYDTGWDVTGCAGKGLTADECKVASDITWDYGLSYTGIPNLTLSMMIKNIFGTRPSVDYRSFGAPSGIIPVSISDIQGRMLKIGMEYKFK